jgi:hypothetical protein
VKINFGVGLMSYVQCTVFGDEAKKRGDGFVSAHVLN